MSRPSTAPVAPTIEQVFLTLPRPTGQIRVGLVKLSGRDLASIRHFYRDPDGEWKPDGRRGIALHAKEAEAAGLALLAVAEAWKRQTEAGVTVETAPGAGA